MIIFLTAVLILCLYGVSFGFTKQTQPARNAFYFNDYLSINKTNAIKGIFILIVFLSHVSGYISLSSGVLDKSYVYLLGKIGQSMVAPFLFYSGFGIMASIDKKGQEYVKALPKNRFLKVLLHFDIAVIMFIIVQFLLGKVFPLKTLLLSLIGWSGVGNSNWYIFVVLCLYITTFAAFSVCKNNRFCGFVLSLALSFVLIFFLHRFKEVWWYDTILCYNLGMGYFFVKDRAEKALFKNKTNYYAVFLICLIVWFMTFSALGRQTFVVMLRNIAFTLIVVLLTMKISIDNKILRFLGSHLFSLYIMQRIPMILLSHFGVQNKYIFVLLSFITTVIIVIPFDALLKKTDSILFFDGKRDIKSR